MSQTGSLITSKAADVINSRNKVSILETYNTYYGLLGINRFQEQYYFGRLEVWTFL